MGFFSKFTRSAKKVQNINQLEAVVAAALVVAAADGEIENAETRKIEALLHSNPDFAAFGKAEISKIVKRYSDILEADFRVGKQKLMKEIRDVADGGDSDAGEAVFLNALSVAEADGEVEPQELKVLEEVGRLLGINPQQYLTA